MRYQWYKAELREYPLLSVLNNFVEPAITMLGPELNGGAKPNRIQWDGLFTFLAKIDGVELGILFNDFRVSGGSFGTENSNRTIAFLDYLEEHKIPCIFFVDALGVRFMEGRTVLKHPVSVIPRLASFASKELLITVSKGNTLGVVAFYFRLGHYRFAIKDKSQINLTGPEVIRLFFGQKYNFEEVSSASHQLGNRRMVQEVLPDMSCILSRIRNLILIRAGKALPETYYEPRKDPALKSFIKPVPEGTPLQSILEGLGSYVEIFEETDSVLRAFIMRRKGRYFGIIANNLGNSNNMVGPQGFAKFSDAFKVFEKLQLPVMSIIDTPGGDPRQAGDNICIIEEMIQAMLSIYHYPYKKLGVVAGRSFGGASMLGMPKAAGGHRVLVLEGSNVGIMHKSILREILKKSPAILEQWEQSSILETEELQDLLANNSIDRLIPVSELGGEVDGFLLELTQDPRDEFVIAQSWSSECVGAEGGSL